jgi:hypothetical protein
MTVLPPEENNAQQESYPPIISMPPERPASKTPWLPWVLVMGILTVAVVVITGFFVLGGDDTTSNSPSSDYGVTEEEGGYDTAYDMMGIVWADFSSSDQENMCDMWNLGMDDLFMETFMDNAAGAGSDLGISDAEVENAVRDFMSDEC